MESIVGTALAAAQSEAHHRSDLQLAEDLHAAEMAQAERFHAEELRQSAELFKLHHTNQWQLHRYNMEVSQDLARRETMRDVWQQRQFLNQTVLLVDALMFSSAMVAISQPNLPATDDPNSWYFGMYGIALSASCFALALSIWASYKVQSRMGGYNVNQPKLIYVCGNSHADYNSYFSCHCEGLRVLATASFFTGTLALLIGSVGVQFIQAEHFFHDLLPGIEYATIIGVATAVVVLLEIFAGDNCAEGPEYGGLEHKETEIAAVTGASGDGAKGWRQEAVAGSCPGKLSA